MPNKKIDKTTKEKIKNIDLNKIILKLSKFELANDRKGIEIIAKIKKLLLVRNLTIF